METLIALANSLPALGVTGLLSLIFVLFLAGRLHTEQEKKDWKELYDQERLEKLQAYQDRKDSDLAVTKLTERLKEHDEMTTRTLDLNERLLEEAMRKTPKRGSG